MTMVIVKPFLGWALTLVLGWLWWRYFKTGVTANKGGKFGRLSNPVGYWFAMAIHALATAVVTGAAIGVTIDALGL